MNFIEYDIYQNKVLGAHILWEFSKSFHEHNKQNHYASIYHTLPVLPLCLNRRVVEGIKNRNFREGSLTKAINENKDIFSGLQERMTNMASITFESIYIGMCSRMFLLEKEKMTLIPNSVNPPEKTIKTLHEDYKDMLNASRRIGSWFSQLNFPEISMYFNITI